VIREARLEIVAGPLAELGEGPCWDSRDGLLLWVDILAGRVIRYDPADGSYDSIDIGQSVGAVAPRLAGGLVLAVRDGFAFLDTGAQAMRLVAAVETDRQGNRMNDGKCDRAGRFFAGTVGENNQVAAGTLYRLDADHRVTQIIGGVTISNGIGWSPDERLMYYVDSHTRRVDVLDYDPSTGSVDHRRPFVKLPSGTGLPDGLTVDAEGFVWVAIWDGAAVHRYRPDGRLDGVIPVPVSKVTSCTFGGPNLDVLYVTTAADVLPTSGRRAPGSGALFACHVRTTGQPANCFNG